MTKSEKIKTAAILVKNVEEIERTIADIQKRKVINGITMPTTDTMRSGTDTVTIPFCAHQMITMQIIDGLEYLKNLYLSEIEETSI